MTALHTAIEDRNIAKIVQILNSGKADVEAEFETEAMYLMRPIHFAVEYGHSEAAHVISLLASAGADVNAKSRDARNPNFGHATALHSAVQKNHLGAAAELISQMADPNLATLGWSPLHVASELNNPVMINLLVSNGADISASHPEHGLTPMHCAALSGSALSCCMLWWLGADLDAKDAKGMTPLDLALSKKSLNTVAILKRLATPSNKSPMRVAECADTLLSQIKTSHKQTSEIKKSLKELARLEAIDLPLTRDGLTALHWLALVNCPDGVEAALSCGASPDALDNEGWTPLMCQSGGNSEYRDHDDEASMRCLDLLVSSSKNLDIADINGLTAAMLATMEWREESAAYLLNAGSNPNSVANDGTSFLMLAAKKGKAGLTMGLLQAGADIDWQDKNGRKAEDIPSLVPELKRILLASREKAIFTSDIPDPGPEPDTVHRILRTL